MLVNLIESVYRLLWGDLFTIPLGGGIGISFMVVLLFTAGIWFTCRTRLLPVRLFRDMIAAVCEKKQGRNGLSSFQTLVISTATRVGMGNLVGVVAAVSAGGAGAVFWMWVTAILGASTSFIDPPCPEISPARPAVRRLARRPGLLSACAGGAQARQKLNASVVSGTVCGVWSHLLVRHQSSDLQLGQFRV